MYGLLPTFANMFHVIHHKTVCNASLFVEKYRKIEQVEAFCAQCPQYGKSWGCPPFDFDVKLLSDGYDRVMLMSSTAIFNADSIQSGQDVKHAIDYIWYSLLPYLYEMEHQYPKSRSFTGRCTLCHNCCRCQGVACRYPKLLRMSLEAAGFDVISAAHDLLGTKFEWATADDIPHKVTLITALFIP